MRSTLTIQADIDSTERAIQQGGVDQSQIDLWNMQLTDFRAELVTAQTAEVNLQVHVETYGYTLDSITIADVPVSECGIDEQSYNILREKVEAVIVGHAEMFTKQLTDQQADWQSESKRLNDLNNQLQAASITAIQENIQLKAENESISTSRDNAARMLDEANAQIEQLNGHIADLQAQIAIGVRGAIKIVPQDEQIKQQEEALKASRIKVTSMVKADPLSDRLWNIVLANTGEQLQINFLEKGKYTVITAEEAAQIEQQKADLAAQNASIPALPQITEEVQANTQDQVQSANSEGTTSTAGNTPLEANVQQGQVGGYNPFPQTGDPATDIHNLQMAHLDLVADVAMLKQSLNIQAAA